MSVWTINIKVGLQDEEYWRGNTHITHLKSRCCEFTLWIIKALFGPLISTSAHPQHFFSSGTEQVQVIFRESVSDNAKNVQKTPKVIWGHGCHSQHWNKPAGHLKGKWLEFMSLTFLYELHPSSSVISIKDRASSSSHFTNVTVTSYTVGSLVFNWRFEVLPSKMS